jgi:hypothetical protein
MLMVGLAFVYLIFALDRNETAVNPLLWLTRTLFYAAMAFWLRKVNYPIQYILIVFWLGSLSVTLFSLGQLCIGQTTFEWKLLSEETFNLICFLAVSVIPLKMVSEHLVVYTNAAGLLLVGSSMVLAAQNYTSHIYTHHYQDPVSNANFYTLCSGAWLVSLIDIYRARRNTRRPERTLAIVGLLVNAVLMFKSLAAPEGTMVF